MKKQYNYKPVILHASVIYEKKKEKIKQWRRKNNNNKLLSNVIPAAHFMRGLWVRITINCTKILHLSSKRATKMNRRGLPSGTWRGSGIRKRCDVVVLSYCFQLLLSFSHKLFLDHLTVGISTSPVAGVRLRLGEAIQTQRVVNTALVLVHDSFLSQNE